MLNIELGNGIVFLPDTAINPDYKRLTNRTTHKPNKLRRPTVSYLNAVNKKLSIKLNTIKKIIRISQKTTFIQIHTYIHTKLVSFDV